MKAGRILLTVIWIVTCTGLSAQVLQACWDQEYQLGESETVHAVMQSMNGWIVSVGSIETANKGLDGFFLVTDPQNGRVLFSKQYGGNGDEAILAVGQDIYGMFYLGGYSHSGPYGGSDGWLLRVNPEGEIIEEAFFGSRDDEKVIHLALFANAGVLLIGQKGKKSTGELWVTRVDNMKQTSQRQIGKGLLKDVVGVFSPNAKSIWLCGNLSDKEAKDGKVGWAWELDTSGNPIDENGLRDIATYDGGELRHMQRSLFGDMVIAGTSLKSRYRNAWVLQLDENGNELFNLTYGNQRLDDFGIAVLKTVQDHLLVARQVPYSSASGQMISEIVLVDGKRDELTYEIPQRNGFVLDKMIYTHDRKIIVLGHSPEKRRVQHIRAVCLEAEQLLALAKAETELTCTAPMLLDQSNDGLLSPGESGAIVFDVINRGTQDLIEGTVSIDGLPISSHYKEVFFSFLPKGGKKTVSIPINGDMLIGKPRLKVNIKVSTKGQPLATFPFEIRSEQSEEVPRAQRLEIISKWETPYSSDTRNNNRPARVSSETVGISYEATSPRELKSTDFRVKKGSSYLENNKQGNRRFSSDRLSNNEWYRHRYTLAFDAPLDTGANVFVIEVLENDQVLKRDTLRFLYTPQQPNLHVLSIGPEGIGLEYNAKDALDFARLMGMQNGMGYFGEVHIDTLVAESATTTKNMSIAFANLQKRYRSTNAAQKIAENDVLVVFISSHGLLIEEDGAERFKIMPSDYDPDFQRFTTVDFEEIILKPLRAINCKKLLFIDACHSGASGVKSDRAPLNKYIMELNEMQPGLISIVSSDAKEYSYENKTWENGAFTKAIREALHGHTVLDEQGTELLRPEITEIDGLPFISVAQLFNYLAIRVPNLVASLDRTLKQTPRKQLDNPELEQIKFIVIPEVQD